MPKMKATPEIKVWAMIEGLMYENKMKLTELAGKSGISYKTVYTDRNNPEKITLSRLFKYFNVFNVASDDVVKMIGEKL